MSFDFLGTLRDVLVIGYLFVLRIGVPLLVTLLLGSWLQKILQEPGSTPRPDTAAPKPDAHCWDTQTTQAGMHAARAAAQYPDMPCWLALQVSGLGLLDACRSCPQFTARTAS